VAPDRPGVVLGPRPATPDCALVRLAAITDKKAGFCSLGDAWANTMTRGRLILTVLGELLTPASALALAVIVAMASSAAAQQGPPPSELPPVLPSGPPPPAPPPSPLVSGLQVTVTPFLALTGTNAAISTPLARAPVVNASVSAFQLLGHLDGVPVAGLVEISDGPFSLLGEALHLPVGTSITTRNVFFSGGSASLLVNEGTADILYHVLAQPAQSLDAGIGFRPWSFTAGLTLNGRIARTVSFTPSARWADPLIAARYHYDFGNHFGFTAYGDFGGFGVGAHTDWQVLGTVDYTLKPWVALRVGYVSLNFDYSANSLPIGFNVHMKGPIFLASFRF
jgi:hypothetical protein